MTPSIGQSTSARQHREAERGTGGRQPAWTATPEVAGEAPRREREQEGEQHLGQHVVVVEEERGVEADEERRSDSHVPIEETPAQKIDEDDRAEAEKQLEGADENGIRRAHQTVEPGYDKGIERRPP